MDDQRVHDRSDSRLCWPSLGGLADAVSKAPAADAGMSRVLAGLGEICRREESSRLAEDDEISQIYFQSDRIAFATARLSAGGSSPLDPGHPAAHEVLYCQRGQVRLMLGAEPEVIDLEAGDAVLIYDGVPHRVTAINGPVELVWCAAPSWSRESGQVMG